MAITWDGASGISASGNITGNYIYGNGAFLTGVSGGGNGQAILNGTSNVIIATANANITMSVDSTENVVVVSTDKIVVAGNVEATGVAAPAIYATNGLNLNARTVTANYTIPNDYNGLSAGPITIANAANINIGTSTWVIV